MKPWKMPSLLLLVISSCFALFSSCGTSTTSSPATPIPSGRTPTATSTALPTSPPSTCGAWSTVSSPKVGTSPIFLNGVAALSTNDVWAVGSYGNGQSSLTLVEHWNGTQWNVVASPNVEGLTSDELLGIAALASNDIWAVGDYDSSHMQPLVEHWDGKAWRIIASPTSASSGNALAAISAISATDIWAVGTTSSANSASGYQPLIEHWNGTQWSMSSSPALSGRLFSVTAIKSNAVWAVGWFSMPNFTGSLIEHWNGTKWSTVSSPNPGAASNALNAVVKVTDNNIWAAGDSSNSVGPRADYTPLVEHWNGTQWSVVNGLLQGTSDLANGMVAISSQNITVVGDYRTGIDPQGPYYTLVEHWDGMQWSVISSPSPGSDANTLLAAVRVPATSSIWAVGFTYGSGLHSGQNSVYQTLTEFHC